MSNVGIIGGADGPTAIFVTSALPRMLNPWGMAIILLMMIPNVIFALRHRNMENRCKSRFINILEQIGRYGCFILMIICIGLDKFGFGSVEDFLIYLWQRSAASRVFYLLDTLRQILLPQKGSGPCHNTMLSVPALRRNAQAVAAGSILDAFLRRSHLCDPFKQP